MSARELIEEWERALREDSLSNEERNMLQCCLGNLRAALPEQPLSPLELAKRFHNYYEKLAPHYGYETRQETRAFDPNSANGRLMQKVCEVILADLDSHESESLELLREDAAVFEEISAEMPTPEAEKGMLDKDWHSYVDTTCRRQCSGTRWDCREALKKHFRESMGGDDE